MRPSVPFCASPTVLAAKRTESHSRSRGNRPQLFLRWSLTIMSRRRALPAPPASQRKPPRMQPIPVLQLFHWHEKGTSHRPPSAEQEILKRYGLHSTHLSRSNPI